MERPAVSAFWPVEPLVSTVGCSWWYTSRKLTVMNIRVPNRAERHTSNILDLLSIRANRTSFIVGPFHLCPSFLTDSVISHSFGIPVTVPTVLVSFYYFNRPSFTVTASRPSCISQWNISRSWESLHSVLAWHLHLMKSAWCTTTATVISMQAASP